MENTPALPLLLAVLLALAAAPLRSAPPAEPEVFSLPREALAAARERAARGDAGTAPALAALRAEADALLGLREPSVMDKPEGAPGGDRHDYLSTAPYWWPDPANPGGPYVRRDGAVNPASKQGTDAPAFARVCRSVGTLGLAHHLTGHAPYAEKAARLTRVWFLDPATRMNPHLEYAQAVRGRNTGRGAGVLESRGLCELTDGLALLAGAAAWTAEDRAGFRKWLEAYDRWLATSANGREERAAKNNHGTWYDVQAVHFALVLGRREAAREAAGEALRRRIATQIEPDGRQPLELARTKSMEYSVFNLTALFQLARLGDAAGADGWGFATPDGRSLRAALASLAPYADPAKAWPKEDLVATDRARLLPLLAEYLAHREDPELGRLLQSHGGGAEHRAARWRLFWPVNAPAVEGRAEAPAGD